MTQHAPTITNDDSFVRFPGLLRRWEIEDVVVPGVTFRVEEAGTTSDGCQLFALYWLKGVDSREPQLSCECGVPPWMEVGSG